MAWCIAKTEPEHALIERGVIPQVTADIPLYDEAAWRVSDKFDWLHHRFAFVRALGQQIWRLDDLPAPPALPFPAVVKLDRNFDGLAHRTYVANSWDDIERFRSFDWSDGTPVVQPYAFGRQWSVDIAYYGGHRLWFIPTECIRSRTGPVAPPEQWHISNPFAFQRFDIHPEVGAVIQKVDAIAAGGYHGILNVEFIGRQVIEAHCRPSAQFLTIYGRKVIEAMDRLYQRRIPDTSAQIERSDMGAVHGYSIPIFQRVRPTRSPPRFPLDLGQQARDALHADLIAMGAVVAFDNRPLEVGQPFGSYIEDGSFTSRWGYVNAGSQETAIVAHRHVLDRLAGGLHDRRTLKGESG